MHISFILPSLWLSGGTRDIVECANGLIGRGHQITLIVPGGTLDPDMQQELDPSIHLLQSSIVRKPRVGLEQMGRLTWSLARAVPPSDVVVSTHTSTTVAGLLAARLFQRGRLAWFYQDYREMFIGKPVEDWLMRNALRWHKLALVLSSHSKQELQSYCPGKVVVVGAGLSHPEAFQPLPANARCRTGNKRTILFLGDMRPRKGLYDFLQAAELVYREERDIELHIVSKETCTIESDVPFEYVYRPTRAELARMYATCDLFVLASWWESFGLPPLEALACGAPVVLTDSRGVRDYARPEENCLMVPIRDPAALAEAMLRVLTDPALAERLRKSGPPSTASFTWERVVDRFEHALNSLFEGAVPGGTGDGERLGT